MTTARRLRAELVAIGTELVLGQGVDTNSAWLSARLAELGIEVTRHTSVDDDVDRIVSVLAEAAGRAQAVIVTGGLGPTQDDLTRVAVARLLGVALERREALAEYVSGYFARAGRHMPESNLVQADLPLGARVLTPQGTAPGFAVEVADTTVYCLPGVPREMRAMATADVFTELAARAGRGATVSRMVRTAGMAESHVAELIDDILANCRDQATIAFLASKGETRVRVTASAGDRDGALARTDPIVAQIVERLGAGVAGLDDEGPEHAVLRQLRELKWTLGLAESMTAGGVAARLARVPGASEVFHGGMVVYANTAKTMLAGVDASILEDSGPVSPETARALATAARVRLQADVGLALVGVAGPTEQEGQPVGRVYLAMSTAGGEMFERELNLPRRSREEIQDFAVSAGLDFLRRRLAGLAASSLF